MTEYNFRAITDTGVRPELVDVSTFGHHRSVGISADSNTAVSCPNHTYVSAEVHSRLRAWAFETEVGRDLFLEHVRKGDFRK